MKTLGIIAYWLAPIVAGTAIYLALGGCMSHEQGLQMHREIADNSRRIDQLEAVLGEPAPPEYQAYNGDGR